MSSPSTPRRPSTRRAAFDRAAQMRWAPALVLVMSLAITAAGWAVASSYASDYAQSRFVADANQLELLIRERMAAQEEILLAGRGLFLAMENVTREDWRVFVDSLNLAENYPGIQGVGFAVHVTPEELDEHVAAVRAEGYVNYDVYPQGEREEYTPIMYLEPFRDRNLRAFGYDMFSDETRRAAMEQARDTGSAALSGRVRLVQETETDVQAGFLMYVPLYEPGAPVDTVEQRREALLGYVYSPYRASNLVRGIISESRPDIEFALYDGSTLSPETLLYDSDPTAESGLEDEALVRTQTLTFAGHDWTIVERASLSSQPFVLASLPFIVLIGGAITSGLLYAVAYSLNTTRERALRLAEDMTRELRNNRDELQASNEALQAFTYVVSHDLKEPVRGVEAYLQILREDHEHELVPEARHLVRGAHDTSVRLAGLLQSLLQLSRVNREGLVMQPLAVGDVLEAEETRLAYERLVQERDARIEVEAPTRVLAAPSVLAQALGNLVANALHHGGAQEPHVRLREVGRRGELVEFVVEDNGGGFPPDFVQRFNMGGNESTSTGFGLLIARRAVERLGGHLWLGHSEALGGAAVHLTLRPVPDQPPPSS